MLSNEECHCIAFSAHAVTSDVSLVEMAKAAEFFGSDGVIVTGTATGEQTNPEHVLGNASLVTRNNVYRAIFVPCNFCPSTFAHSFEFAQTELCFKT